MAKAASPVRLQQELMLSASLTAERYHRSTAEQIEYWAAIGQKVSSILTPDALLSIVSGVSKVKLEPVTNKVISPTQVFNSLEYKRQEAEFKNDAFNGAVRYQICEKAPAYLERINANNSVDIGQFTNGVFIVKNK